MPAFQPPALQDIAPAACRHSGTESVLALPSQFLGLIGPLRHVLPPWPSDIILHGSFDCQFRGLPHSAC
jgi:hypothetical protein